MEVTRLQKEDCKELVAFLDEVFTLQNGHQMDFSGTFPRIFREKAENMGWYYAVKEDGKIIGTAASHPLTYRVGDETLNISAGGNVAVSPACRNRGLMQLLLNRINEDLDEFDLAYLHGDRKRYRTFGFEKCGIEYLVYFTPSMLKKEGCVADVTLRRLEPADVATAMAICKQQYSGLVWEAEEFFSAQIAHKNHPLGIFREEALVGYVSLDVPGAYLAEIALADPGDFGSVLAALCDYVGGKTLVIRLPAYEKELLRRAITLSGRYNIIQPANFSLSKLDKVLRVFLKAKGQYAPLMEGRLTVDTELWGKWDISCQDGQVTVVPGAGQADIFLPGYRAYEFFFGPNAPFLAEVTANMPPDKALLAANWFPIPLFCPHLA